MVEIYKNKCTKVSSKKEYILLTMHRAENVDNKDILTDLITAMEYIQMPIIYPIHPRTKRNQVRAPAPRGKLRLNNSRRDGLFITRNEINAPRAQIAKTTVTSMITAPITCSRSSTILYFGAYTPNSFRKGMNFFTVSAASFGGNFQAVTI